MDASGKLWIEECGRPRKELDQASISLECASASKKSAEQSLPLTSAFKNSDRAVRPSPRLKTICKTKERITIKKWILVDSTLKLPVLPHHFMMICWNSQVCFMLNSWTSHSTQLSPLTDGSQIKSLKVTVKPYEAGETDFSSLQAMQVLASDLVQCKMSLMHHWRQQNIRYVPPNMHIHQSYPESTSHCVFSVNAVEDYR